MAKNLLYFLYLLLVFALALLSQSVFSQDSIDSTSARRPLYGEEKSSVLDLIYRLRTANIAKLESGVGKASMLGKRTNLNKGSVYIDEKIDSNVTFTFSGSNIVSKQDKGHSCLHVGNRVVKYWPGNEEFDAPPSVRIFKEFDRPSIFKLFPDKWSLANYAEIPDMQFDEEEIMFEHFKTSEKGKVYREGDNIILEFNRDPTGEMKASGIDHDSFELVFALDAGGMLRRMKKRYDTCAPQINRQRTLEIEIQWEATGGTYIPTSFRSHVLAKDGNTLLGDSSIEITFNDVELKEIDSSLFDITSLDIKPGTPIVDEIMGIQYAYGIDTGQNTGGENINMDIGNIDNVVLDQASDIPLAKPNATSSERHEPYTSESDQAPESRATPLILTLSSVVVVAALVVAITYMRGRYKK
jgi:hypothetical protein